MVDTWRCQVIVSIDNVDDIRMIGSLDNVTIRRWLLTLRKGPYRDRDPLVSLASDGDSNYYMVADFSAHLDRIVVVTSIPRQRNQHIAIIIRLGLLNPARSIRTSCLTRVRERSIDF